MVISVLFLWLTSHPLHFRFSLSVSHLEVHRQSAICLSYLAPGYLLFLYPHALMNGQTHIHTQEHTHVCMNERERTNTCTHANTQINIHELNKHLYIQKIQLQELHLFSTDTHKHVRSYLHLSCHLLKSFPFLSTFIPDLPPYRL